uniref:Carbonic anhydrase n=2 Tax=Denticeps clupeoides TaxID=299321 RepID=A0AAY4DHL5_9TELE
MLCVIMPALVLQFNLLTSVRGAKWTYSGPYGEQSWSRSFPFCGGAFQSPIDFQTPILRYDPALSPIEVKNYNLPPSEQLTMSNNGHSVKLSLPSSMHISSMPYRYSASQLHLHWGSSSLLEGSEHTINGKQFPAELHIVHFNSDKYSNISVALDKSDGLAVLGILIEVGNFNPAFDRFLKYLNGVKFKDQKVQIAAFNIRELLPDGLHEYYRYDGSLTTPPCYPSVLWTVFKNPVTVSRQQFLSLATSLYSSSSQESAPEPLNRNFRKTQLADNRVILVSFQQGRGPHGSLRVVSPLVKRRIIQQLLAGDLADLADEELYKLLPNIRQMPWASNKWIKTKSQQSHYQDRQKNRLNAVFAPKTSQDWQHLGRFDLNEGTIDFSVLKQDVELLTYRAHDQDSLVQSLRNAVFPELNLRSYLSCKSELDLATIRKILSGRRTDEVNEMDQSLTKAL